MIWYTIDAEQPILTVVQLNLEINTIMEYRNTNIVSRNKTNIFRLDKLF